MKIEHWEEIESIIKAGGILYDEGKPNERYVCVDKETLSIHREDGPAIVYTEIGSVWWYRYGDIHREDGPAVIGNGYKEYWLNGFIVKGFKKEEST